MSTKMEDTQEDPQADETSTPTLPPPSAVTMTVFDASAEMAQVNAESSAPTVVTPLSFFTDLHSKYVHIVDLLRHCDALAATTPRTSDQSMEVLKKATHLSDDILVTIDREGMRTDWEEKGACRLVGMKGIMLCLQADILERIGEERLTDEMMGIAQEVVTTSLAAYPELWYVVVRVAVTQGYRALCRNDLAAANRELCAAWSMGAEWFTRYIGEEWIFCSTAVHKDQTTPERRLPDCFTEEDLFAPCETLTNSYSSQEKMQRLIGYVMECLSCVHERLGNQSLAAVSRHCGLNIMLNILQDRQAVFGDLEPPGTPEELAALDGETILWIDMCNHLTLFCVSMQNFSAARSHLATATDVLQTYGTENSARGTEMREEFARVSADLAKTEALYGLKLFEHSRKKLLEATRTSQQDGHRDDDAGSDTCRDEGELQQAVAGSDGDVEEGAGKEGMIDKGAEETGGNDDANEVRDAGGEAGGCGDVKGCEKTEMEVAKDIEIVADTAKGSRVLGTSEKDLPVDEGEANRKRVSEKGGTGDAFDFVPLPAATHPAGEEDHPSLPLPLPTPNFPSHHLESTIPGPGPVTSRQGSRRLFAWVRKRLRRALAYYTGRPAVPDPLLLATHIDLLVDLAELHRYAALYEGASTGQFRMIAGRRRALRAIQTVLQVYRPENYIDVSIELHRELAETAIEEIAFQMIFNGWGLREVDKKGEEEMMWWLEKMEGVRAVYEKLREMGARMGHCGGTGERYFGSAPEGVLGGGLMPQAFAF